MPKLDSCLSYLKKWWIGLSSCFSWSFLLISSCVSALVALLASAYEGYQFYLPSFIDFRGRIYRSGILHFHERDLARSKDDKAFYKMIVSTSRIDQWEKWTKLPLPLSGVPFLEGFPRRRKRELRSWGKCQLTSIGDRNRFTLWGQKDRKHWSWSRKSILKSSIIKGRAPQGEDVVAYQSWNPKRKVGPSSCLPASEPWFKISLSVFLALATPFLSSWVRGLYYDYITSKPIECALLVRNS